MAKWHHIFLRSTGLSSYVSIILLIVPFYFIFRAYTPAKIAVGFALILLFFFSYWYSFRVKGWLVYFWTGVQIVISIMMTLFFSYVYFAVFLAFFIGNVQNKAGFYTLYAIHLTTTILTINYGFVTRNNLLFEQFPFILVCLIIVILLPFNTHSRMKQEQLEGQLEDANKRIAEFVKLEERQRIARDLHDTLGQRLSLIGLKSDLASKLIYKKPEQARREMNDVQQTARSALKEVREMVTQMRGARLSDEVQRAEQMLQAASIEWHLEGSPKLLSASPLIQNVLSMCLKEAVTNVVRHSEATSCTLEIEESASEWKLTIRDNGQGFPDKVRPRLGNGLRGMKERLEFVNGTLNIADQDGLEIVISVPHVHTRS